MWSGLSWQDQVGLLCILLMLGPFLQSLCLKSLHHDVMNISKQAKVVLTGTWSHWKSLGVMCCLTGLLMRCGKIVVTFLWDWYWPHQLWPFNLEWKEAFGERWGTRSGYSCTLFPCLLANNKSIHGLLYAQLRQSRPNIPITDTGWDKYINSVFLRKDLGTKIW